LEPARTCSTEKLCFKMVSRCCSYIFLRFMACALQRGARNHAADDLPRSWDPTNFEGEPAWPLLSRLLEHSVACVSTVRDTRPAPCRWHESEQQPIGSALPSDARRSALTLSSKPDTRVSIFPAVSSNDGAGGPAGAAGFLVPNNRCIGTADTGLRPHGGQTRPKQMPFKHKLR
jgi:hypothetical protein